MTQGNNSDATLKVKKNKDLQRLTGPSFHDAESDFIFLLPRKKRQLCTSLRWRCTLMRMPKPTKSVSSAVPP
jgi:hypothetical protein